VLEKADLLGAIVTHAIYVLGILVFVFRLLRRPRSAFWSGLGFVLMGLPLIYLLALAPRLQRAGLYYIQVGLMLLFLVVTFFLDYWPRVEFRGTRWMVITYVTLFFAGAGGMLGVTALAEGAWVISAVVLFFIMTGLAFYQRSVTGM
jgi:hypothetical protein